MKSILLALLTFLLLPLLSFDSQSLVGRPMPLLPEKTLDGKTIDENYFKGHVTIVSFMAMGCVPCMNEINTLNKLQEEYAAKGVQVLCIARQMREQMIKFNGDDKDSYFHMLRNAMKVETIKYTIQPGCADKQSTAVETKDNAGNINVTLKCECNTLEEKYGVSALPVTFYVDRNGIIIKTKLGGPRVPNDSDYYAEVKKQIEEMLGQ